MLKPEELARQQIDELLARCGWKVRDHKRLGLSAARGIAIMNLALRGTEADFGPEHADTSDRIFS